jgi:hypothetical protein
VRLQLVDQRRGPLGTYQRGCNQGPCTAACTSHPQTRDNQPQDCCGQGWGWLGPGAASKQPSGGVTGSAELCSCCWLRQGQCCLVCWVVTRCCAGAQKLLRVSCRTDRQAWTGLCRAVGEPPSQQGGARLGGGATLGA